MTDGTQEEDLDFSVVKSPSYSLAINKCLSSDNSSEEIKTAADSSDASATKLNLLENLLEDYFSPASFTVAKVFGGAAFYDAAVQSTKASEQAPESLEWNNICCSSPQFQFLQQSTTSSSA